VRAISVALGISPIQAFYMFKGVHGNNVNKGNRKRKEEELRAAKRKKTLKRVEKRRKVRLHLPVFLAPILIIVASIPLAY
jgi:hypothetical protein